MQSCPDARATRSAADAARLCNMYIKSTVQESHSKYTGLSACDACLPWSSHGLFVPTGMANIPAGALCGIQCIDHRHKKIHLRLIYLLKKMACCSDIL